MNIRSLLREAEYSALAKIELSGNVLDIGGSRHSAYRGLIRGRYTVTTINIDERLEPEIIADLEQPFLLPSEAYDAVLLINVLEHIFEYRQLLSESVRVLKVNGTIVIVVPFLFPIHPSPHDFHRFTGDALRRECERLSLNNIHIESLGGGVFSARYVLLERLLPYPAHVIAHVTLRFIVSGLDFAAIFLGYLFGKKYNPSDYALGYCVKATKASA